MKRRVVWVNKPFVKKYNRKWLTEGSMPLPIVNSRMLFCLLEQSLTGIFLSRQGKVLYLNSRLANMFGYTQEEMMRAEPMHLVHPEDRGLVVLEMQRRMEGEKGTSPFWIRGIRKDGTYFYYEIHAQKIIYKGAPALLGTVLDMTSKIQADELGHENDLRYQRLITYLPEPIFVHDGASLLYVNRAGIKLLGSAEAESILTRPYLDFIHPDSRNAIRQQIDQAMASDEPFGFIEAKLINLDGSVIDAECSSIRIHNFLGRPHVVQTVFRDITGRKREEEALIKSEKLSVAGQMAAGIAHEIRNPLTSLKGFSQFLKKKIDGYHSYFDIMLTELDRINSIVQEFMALAKPQASRFENCEIVQVVKGVITLLETQAVMNNVQIEMEVKDRLPLVYCDENQLKQVFINLLKNAIEAMPSGGQVHIVLRSSGFGKIAVSIQDYGEGIAKDRLELLGGPFYTTKSSGTGLGLMICNRIINAHQGELRFESEPGFGTTVTVVLPAAYAEPAETGGRAIHLPSEPL
ncbi:PAS domain-containing sensor histidine kinase [Paenibacillus humicola]|uniref:PAS domain-containing sensor histidine kinase n=1 Tax=Paenibacillus humicola TaxID=3110540 RepID=UPI00237AE526|nr:PAS domain-containing sensor histidine kinase [Paenibacillus humicola]